MIARRGFLAGLAAAPVAAKQAMEDSMTISPASLAQTGIQTGAADPVVESARRFLESRREKRLRGLDMGHHFSVSIACKRSWSPVYKQHVHEAEYWELMGDKYVWQMSEAEILAEAMRRGWSEVT